MRIELPKRGSSKLGESIHQLTVDFLNPLNGLLEQQRGLVEIDVSPCEFITPILAVPLAVFRNGFKEDRLSIRCDNHSAISSYFKTIHLPGGLRPEDIENQDYKLALNQYAAKTYIPVVNFPVSQSKAATEIRDGTLQSLHELLKTQLSPPVNFVSGLFYLIDELVNNVADHSMSDRGFIFAQYYPADKHLELCIADNGVGILGAFKENGIDKYNTDEDAIGAAIMGESSKKVAGRGFGIRTSIRMLVEGMGGDFFLMSGKAFLLRAGERSDVKGLPDSVRWNGTLISMKIPFINAGFEYASFLE